MLQITFEQDKDIKHLFELMEGQGLSDDVIREKILETHVKKGWKGTRTESLDALSIGEMATVLYGEYLVEKRKFSLQEYLVHFKVNDYIKLTNLVSVSNDYELDESEIINKSINYLSSFNVQKDMFEKIEVVRKVE